VSGFGQTNLSFYELQVYRSRESIESAIQFSSSWEQRDFCALRMCQPSRPLALATIREKQKHSQKAFSCCRGDADRGGSFKKKKNPIRVRQFPARRTVTRGPRAPLDVGNRTRTILHRSRGDVLPAPAVQTCTTGLRIIIEERTQKKKKKGTGRTRFIYRNKARFFLDSGPPTCVDSAADEVAKLSTVSWISCSYNYGEGRYVVETSKPWRGLHFPEGSSARESKPKNPHELVRCLSCPGPERPSTTLRTSGLETT